jgi:ribonuclease PH
VTGWGTSTLTINPTASLLAGTGYYVKVANTAVTDLAGNAYAGIADATTFNFTVLNSDGSIPVVPPYGGTANSVLGWSVAGAGDVNGDGYDDVIVTAKNEDATYKGAAYVIYGNASGKGADLSGGTIASSLGFKISGGISDFLGSIVTGIGDVNGDGFADVLVATDKANSATTINAAYVVYGSATNANVDLANGTISSTVGYKVAGGTGNSNFANDVAGAGDFNGDGLADMIVSGHVDSGTGGAYVVYGKKTYSNLDLSAGTIASSDGIKITGGASDGMGWSVSGAGDVNGDGLSDVIIGAATNPSAYVVYGTTSAASIDLSSGTIASNVGFKLSNGGTYGGYAISSIGDVNGDGFADVAYGAYNGYGVSGNAFVVYGGNTVPSLNLNTAIAPSVGFKITGLSGIGPREFLSSAGDVNGDGLGDLIVSSYLEDKTYVVYGNTTGANIDLSGGTIASSAGFALKQPVSGQLGFSVSSAGDINGDGLADLILGAPTTNSSSGAYYYVLGGTSTITTVANLTGTSAGEAVLGTAGADTLTGGGGVDRFYAGAGNDTIVLQASDATNLSATTGATRALVSGGNGFDTIRLNGTNLDLTAVSNAGAMGLEENSRVESIEGIDMRTDTAANTLTIAAKDVADMADFNSIHLTTVSDDGKTWTNVGAGTALSATTKFHQVVVDGTSADTLNLAAGNGFWTNAGEVNNGTTGYYVYQNTAMNSQVIVDKTVVVNNPDNKAVAGDAVIDLGANGKLIAPVQVEGNWYYFWDRSGNGVADSADLAMHSDVDPIFNKDINGNVHTGATNDTYRYATLNGVKVALPRFGATYTGDLPLNPQYEQFNGTAATIGGTSIPYDDMMAIWDINNGTSTAKYQTGLPSGWSGASWWMTASMSSFGGNYVVTSNMESAAPTGDYQISAIALQVLPVVIDLNRDGILSYGQVTMDVNGDGHLDTTKWAGAQDGVLVWDKFADGLVHNNSQYAFGQYATTYRTDALGHARAATDLEGLADAFDTNHDGVFNAADAQFGEFKVWQDANQNGVSDAGEVRSLADLGISSINLTSDGVVRTPVDGVTEAGQTTATAIDGSSVLVSDAGFAYSALDYAVTGSAMNLLGANMHLDLSSVVAVHSDVAAVDLTGTGANTVKLNLADVLSVATDASIANGVHKLTLTGDANDTVELDLSQWANTGTTVTEGDHTYAVYNAAASAAAQLLIDQHMVLANHG